jgi:signal transduction histidine kinase
MIISKRGCKKSSKHSKLWLYFVMIVFAVLCVTFIIMGLIIFIFMHLEIIVLSRDFQGRHFFPISSLLFLSIIVGTAVTLFVAKRIVKPITQLSQAVSEVAKGNFDIRLNEKERIKEIRELSQNFNAMAFELSRVDTLRSDFVDNVSHEFKTPISAINGYATLLQDKNISEKERDEYIRLIIDGTKNLSRLSTNVLSLSKIENQEVIIDKKDFRLDEQIREIVLLLENNWDNKNINLNINLKKIIYNGNKELLALVWFNLIENAIKFTPNGGKIEIRLYKSNRSYIVEIKDSGIGIEESEIHRIYDKFYQGDKARREVGNGIGLALVSRIVNLCNGIIETQSRVGSGSTFTVYLPIE